MPRKNTINKRVCIKQTDRKRNCNSIVKRHKHNTHGIGSRPKITYDCMFHGIVLRKDTILMSFE